MTDSVTPGDGVHDADPYLTAGAIRYGGGDWIVPDTETYYAAHEGLSGLPLDEFEAKHSTGSFDVTIGTGEAFVAGSWLGRDTQTTVTLDSQTNGQTVYLGWKKGTSNAVVVGTASAFSSDWPRVAIWEFDTNASGVASARDLRPLGEQIDVRNEGSAAKADSADRAAMSEDSARLGGSQPNKYLRSDQNEELGGNFTARGKITSQSTGASKGVVVTTPGGDPAFIPILNGSPQNDKAMRYDTDINEYQIPGSPQAGGSTILTESDESALSVSNADELNKTGEVLSVMRSPNVNTPTVRLSGDDDLTIAQIADYNGELEVWRWGVIGNNVRLRLGQPGEGYRFFTTQTVKSGDPGELNPIGSVSAKNGALINVENTSGSETTFRAFVAYRLE